MKFLKFYFSLYFLKIITYRLTRVTLLSQYVIKLYALSFVVLFKRGRSLVIVLSLSLLAAEKVRLSAIGAKCIL